MSIDPDPENRRGEALVRSFYERTPYPDLGAKPKNPGWITSILDELPDRAPIRYLEAGCGTGHGVVGVASRHPDWAFHAIDLSEPSLDIARRLADKHGVRVAFERGSYLDPLPFDGKFDLISCAGTIHHCEDPPSAVRNLVSRLADDGFIYIHLYGKDLDREKFVIREVLDILEPDIDAIERRFALYSELVRSRRKRPVEYLLDLSARVVLRTVRDAIRARLRRARGESWSPPWNQRYDEPTAPWVDHFCHPLERSYSVRDVQALAEAGGLEVVRMLAQGREDTRRLPPGWTDAFAKLDQWSRWRLMELLDSTARSVSLIGRRARG